MVFLQHMGYHKLAWYREIMNTHCHLMALLGRQSCSQTTVKPVITATHKIIVCSPATLDIWFTWKQQVITVALAIKVDKTKVRLWLAAGGCGEKICYTLRANQWNTTVNKNNSNVKYHCNCTTQGNTWTSLCDAIQTQCARFKWVHGQRHCQTSCCCGNVKVQFLLADWVGATHKYISRNSSSGQCFSNYQLRLNSPW